MTTTKEQLIQEIEQTPDILVGEVLDFLLFLKQKTNKLTQQNKLKTDEKVPSVLNIIDEIETAIPVEADEELPKDFAKNLDHYLYGIPKETHG